MDSNKNWNIGPISERTKSLMRCENQQRVDYRCRQGEQNKSGTEEITGWLANCGGMTHNRDVHNMQTSSDRSTGRSSAHGHATRTLSWMVFAWSCRTAHPSSQDHGLRWQCGGLAAISWDQRSRKQSKGSGQASHSEQMATEVLKDMGQVRADVLMQLCNKIWKTVTGGMAPPIFIHSYKKRCPAESSNYRTVVLILHASKVLLHIIHDRLKNFLLLEITEKQSSFIPGKGTRTNIECVSDKIEKARKLNVGLCQRSSSALSTTPKRLTQRSWHSSLEYSPWNGSTPLSGVTCEKSVWEQHGDYQCEPENFWDPKSTSWH